MAAILRKLRLREISFVDKGANPGARVVLMKRDGDKTMSVKKGLESLVELEALGLSDEQKKAVLALLEAVKGQPMEAPKPVEPVQDAAPVAPPAPEKKPEDVVPVPPVEEPTKKNDDVSKRLEDAEKARVELAKRVQQLEDEKETVLLQKSAEARPFVPMSTEKQVEILKSAKKLGEDNLKTIEEMFDKVNKAMEAAPVLKKVGSKTADGSVEKLEEIAKKKIEDAQAKGTKLPFASAYKQAAKENPALFGEESNQE